MVRFRRNGFLLLLSDVAGTMQHCVKDSASCGLGLGLAWLVEEHHCMWLLFRELLIPTRTIIDLFLFYCDLKAVKYALYPARTCAMELWLSDWVMTLDAPVGDNGSVFVWANRCLVPGGGNLVLRLQNVQTRLWGPPNLGSRRRSFLGVKTTWKRIWSLITI